MQDRISWIDRARGIALICVVVGHLGPSVIGKYITSFHIPLFFFLSGLTFSHEDSFGVFLRKKAKRLLVPYFCLGIPLIFAAFVQRYADGVKDIREYGYVVVKFLVQERTYTLWFIACLFVLLLVFYFLTKICKDKLLLLGAVSFTMGIGGVALFHFVPTFRLPWNADVCLVAIPFFYLGYLMKKKKADKSKVFNSWLVFAAGAVAYIISVYLNQRLTGQKLDIAVNTYGNPAISFVSAASGILCAVIFTKKITFLKFDEYLGKNTMVYFAWHQTIAQPLLLALYDRLNLFQSGSLISDGIRFLVTSVLSFAVLIPFDLLLSKTKLKVIVGK